MNCFLFSDVRYDNAEETKCDIIARFKTMPYDSNFLWHFFQFGKRGKKEKDEKEESYEKNEKSP